MNPRRTIDLVRSLLAAFATLALCAIGSAQTFSYDGAGRLTQVTYESGKTISYVYDANGNLVSQNTTAQPPSGGGGGGGGGGCFIATAAYGSPLDEHVQSLRDFRESWLRTNVQGRAFIAFYERASPPLAAFIAEREWARTLARLGLTPIVFGVEHPASTCALLAAFAALLVVRARRRRQLANVTTIL